MLKEKRGPVALLSQPAQIRNMPDGIPVGGLHKYARGRHQLSTQKTPPNSPRHAQQDVNYTH